MPNLCYLVKLFNKLNSINFILFLILLCLIFQFLEQSLFNISNFLTDLQVFHERHLTNYYNLYGTTFL